MKRFTQSMLVVLMALFGLNLQAGAAVKTYDFAAAAASAESDVTLTASERAAGSNNMGTALVFPNELQDLLQDQFGFFFRGECTVSLSKAEGGLTMVGTKDTYMSVLNLKAGDKVTVTYSTGTILFCDKAGSNNPEGLTNVEGITEQWAPLNSGQAYTMLVDGHFNFQWKKAKTVITKIEIESSAAAESGATFDFNALDVATSSGSNETLTHDGDITEPYVQTVDGVTLTVSPAAEDAKNPNRFWGTNAGPQLRCYSGTITLESATAFKSIEFDAPSKFSLTPDVGELSGTTWSGDATKVVFTVNGNTQINKIVVSSEAAVTPEPPVIVAATIADFKALEKGTEAKLTLKDAFVTAVSGSNAYVQDATGALYFYNSGLTFVAGTKLNGSVMGKLDIYNNLPEFTKSADTNADDITATDGVATPKNIAVAEVEQNISMLVKLANVAIAEDGGKYYVVDGETKYQIYDQFKVLAEGFTYPEKADIVAIVGMYKGTPQLYPLDANSISEAASAPVPDGTYYIMCAAEEGDWFMAAGHSWGTRAIMNNEGLDLTLAYDAPTGKYTIDSRVSNGGNNHFLGSNLFMDSPAFGWTIAPTSSITFTIGNGTQYIGYDTDYNLVLTDTPVEWAFIDAAYLQADRMEKGLESLKAATKESGVDATFLIKDAQFNRNDLRWEAWKVSENCTNKNLGGGCDGNSSNGCAESYHSAFTISQVLEGAPAGIYQLSAQGFYRQDDNVVEPAPYVFIGDAKGEIGPRTGTENNMTEAGNAFEQGLYSLEPIAFTYYGDDQLTVGVSNDENLHQWVIWDNFKLTYFGAADPNFREVTVNVDRYPGLGYGVTDAQADLSIAKKWLGVDTLTYDMLRIENPNGELISDYAPFDGWFNGDGVAENWGDNTKICVKFFQALTKNGQFEICDMNGADEVGKTYSVKWQLVSGEKAVRYTINVQFVEKPTLDLTFADLSVKGEFTTAFASQTGSCYEGLKSDVDVPAILAAAGAASLDDVAIYAVQSDGSLDDNYKLGTTDGWRNAAGDWQGWGANAYFYVKADFSRESEQLYEVGGMDPSQNANMNVPGSYTATYAFVKKGTADAAVLKVTLTYTAADGIETATMTTGSESTIYNLRGQQVEKPTKGLYIVNGKKVVIK